MGTFARIMKIFKVNRARCSLGLARCIVVEVNKHRIKERDYLENK